MIQPQTAPEFWCDQIEIAEALLDPGHRDWVPPSKQVMSQVQRIRELMVRIGKVCDMAVLHAVENADNWEAVFNDCNKIREQDKLNEHLAEISRILKISR